jgi:capsular exopolysaccharide synthesis family protein
MHNRLLDQPLAAEASPSSSGPSLWEILWQRKAYVALGAVAGLVLGVLYWSMAPKTYESSAQVWVLKKHPDAPISAAGAADRGAGESNANTNASEDFLGTHQSVLRSTVILNDAMKRGQLDALATFQDSKQPTRSLARALTVGRDRDKTMVGGPTSQVLNVSFRCGHAEDCVPVLSAVLDSYRDYLDSRTHNTAQKTLELIVKARDLLQNDLEAKEKARDEFLLNTPVLWKTQYGTTLHQERLGNIDAQRALMDVRRAQLKATLAAADEALKQGRSHAELLDIVSAMPSHTPVTRMARRDPRSLTPQSMGREPNAATTGVALSGSLEQEMVHLQLEEGRLLASYGANHPQVQALRDRLQTVRVLLAPTTTPESSTPEGRRRDMQAKDKLVDLRLAQLKQELSDSERGLSSLESLFQSEMQEAKKVFPYETQESSLRRTINRSQLLYDNINQRLKELNVVRDTGGFDTQVITPPTEAEKVSPRGSLVLPMGLLLGLLLGCGLAYLAELTDKSFRSPEDVRRRLGLPVMGVVPRVKGIGKSSSRSGNGEGWLDGSVCTWHRPSSAEAEAYRGVRTALYFSTRGQGRKIIQITSPSHGAGKSTLAANLAVCMAQSGKNVLLVDGDLRRPRVSSLFGVSPSVGFASVLGGLAEVSEVVTETSVPGLSVIGSGPLPPNPSELLTSARLRESLSWMREHYDYVLVDTPPLLAVTDPGVVASQMDGVIVTLRSSKKGRVEAERAKEVLDNLGVPIFGIVLNAVDAAQNGTSYTTEDISERINS